jgi:hypothetical protein
MRLATLTASSAVMIALVPIYLTDLDVDMQLELTARIR